MKDYRSILSRCGWIIIIAGVLDIGIMVWCIVNQISYASSFNIFAVIAGIFLLRGNLRAARLISFFMSFFIAGFFGILVLMPFLLPPDLVITYFKLEPTSFLLISGLWVLVMVLLVWSYRELTCPPVRAAMDKTQVDYRSFWRRPARGFWFGACVVVILLGLVRLITGGSTAEQAKQRAAVQAGPEFRFHVTSLNTSSSGGTKHVRAVVAAYNDREIQTIIVEWSE